MPLPAWAICVIGFVRGHARHVFAAATLVAVLIAIWWFGSLRGGSTPQRAELGASLATHTNDAPFTAQLRMQRPPLPAAGEGLCGYGPLPVVDGIPQIPPDLETKAASSFHRLAADLAAGPTDRDRALGMYLQMIEAGDAAGRAWNRVHGACADDHPACQSDMAQAVAAGTSAYQHALVRLATTTSDADAYALALYSCGRAAGQSRIGDCALLSYAQWARLEPDNAVPWIYLAAEAERRHDRSSVETNLNRASKSRYSDPHSDAIARFLASEAYQAEPPPIQIQLAGSLVGIQAAFPLPSSLRPDPGSGFRRQATPITKSRAPP